MIIQSVSFPMSDIFCRTFTHFKKVMIILHCNYGNDMGGMLTIQKTNNKQLH